MDYLDAGDLLRSLKELRLSGRLSVSSARNALLYAGPASERDRIRALIHRLDVPGRQVTLQATILAVNRSAERDLGIHWTWDTLPQYEKSSGGTTSDTNETYAGHFRLWPSSSAQFHFNAALHALLTTGKARVLATPSLITLPGKEASIFIGSHIPVVTEKRSDGESNYATEYVDAGIKLTYLPFVGRDGLITSQVHTEVSTPVLVSELKNYRINSRTADTTVRLKNGETLAIGGLVSEEEQRQLQQIPLLSKIPVLGELFKYRFRSKTKTEVIILLTPYLTDAGQSPAIYNPSLQDNASGPSRKADS
ncbi:MAG: type II secretion system protein GspD [Succiniclasticum sp.]